MCRHEVLPLPAGDEEDDHDDNQDDGEEQDGYRFGDDEPSDDVPGSYPQGGDGDDASSANGEGQADQTPEDGGGYEQCIADLEADFEAWMATRGLDREATVSLNLVPPVDATEESFYGPVMTTQERRYLAHQAFHDCGLASYLASLGASVPSSYSSFGCHVGSLAELSLAPVLAQDFLVYRPYSLGNHQFVIIFSELQVCIVGMANILLAYSRLVDADDDLALSQQTEQDKFDGLVRSLLSVLERNNGSSIGASMPEVVTNLYDTTLKENLESSTPAQGDEEVEVSLRLLNWLVYFVGARFG